MRNTLSALTLFVVTALLLVTPVVATPIETGCPSAYDAKTVAEWEALDDYILPRLIDDAGNHDGTVCGLAWPDGFRWGRVIVQGNTPRVDVYYNFIDNDNPAQR